MKRSQNDVVLDYLRSGKKLTNKTAMEELGIGRLASRICDLRKQGHEITGTTKKMDNRYGGKSLVTEYSIEKEQA